MQQGKLLSGKSVAGAPLPRASVGLSARVPPLSTSGAWFRIVAAFGFDSTLGSGLCWVLGLVLQVVTEAYDPGWMVPHLPGCRSA